MDPSNPPQVSTRTGIQICTGFRSVLSEKETLKELILIPFFFIYEIKIFDSYTRTVHGFEQMSVHLLYRNLLIVLVPLF